MKVWIVIGEIKDATPRFKEIYGVYSTQDKASAQIDSLEINRPYVSFRLKEYEIDGLV